MELKDETCLFEVAGAVQSEVWILFRLPCTDFNDGLFGIVDINHQEEIALVAVG